MYYIRVLQPLQRGQPINIYDHHAKRWEHGTVVRPAKEPRSYIVKNDRTEVIYRRTRSQLKPIPDAKSNTYEPVQAVPEAAAPQESPATQPTDNQAYRTRSGRISRPQDQIDWMCEGIT